MNRQQCVKIFSWGLVVITVLIAVLLIHIFIVTRPSKNGEEKRQLSRIDFKQPVDSSEAAKIRSFVMHLPGVESTLFNVKAGILVYTYSLDKQTSINVFNELIKYGNYKATRYIVDAAAIKSGCPVMENNQSFNNYISVYISSFFNSTKSN